MRVESVTGLLPPAEREARIAALAAEPGQYVLVCTDCLSEGINLQQHFNAVLHYDLAWNPTRHEQREGRVDRFGQEKPEVRVVTYYGTDNPIDGVILDVLIRKHKSIKSDLGVTVAVPGSSEQIAEALFEGALFREKNAVRAPRSWRWTSSTTWGRRKQALHAEWENARDREKASRSRFAQHTLSPRPSPPSWQSVRAAIGRSEDVARFFHAVLQAANVPVQTAGKAVDRAPQHRDAPRALRQAIGRDEPFTGRFDLPLEEGEVYLGRTSPIIEGLASWTLDQALDPVARDARPVAARCGVISTSAVEHPHHAAGGPLPLPPADRRRGRGDHPVRGDRPAGLHRPGGRAAVAHAGGRRAPARRPPERNLVPDRHRPAARPAAPGPAQAPAAPWSRWPTSVPPPSSPPMSVSARPRAPRAVSPSSPCSRWTSWGPMSCCRG